MGDHESVIPTLDEPIRTRRLTVRAVQADDAETSVQLMTDPEAQRYFHGPLDIETARHRSRRRIGEPGRFCVILRSTGERLGFVTMGSREKRTDDLAVSYAFLSEHWGHGYAREAVLAVITWTFNNLTAAQAPRIVAVTRVHNRPSRRLLETIGMSCVSTFDEPVGQLAMYAITHPAAGPSTGH